jgi:non-specific serine/threonine protein kinase
MKPERWEQIGEIYHAALELPCGQRAAFLNEACAGDQELRREIESLIAAERRVGDFIADPVLPVAKVLKDAAQVLADDASSSLTSSLASLPEGQSFGHYRIVSLLGAGGMGEVYLAHDPRLDRQVALKLLLADYTSDEARVRRFLQEARAVSALNHPNIITIHEIGQSEGRHYIATEFIEGRTLRLIIVQGKPALSEAIEIAVQTAGALQAAHDAGIVHRDIKPENIMVRPDGLVKVLDFGLAKLIERPGAMTFETNAPSSFGFKTEPGTIIGTVSYMSPEQLRGWEVDACSDIFSLGVVFYEMIAGRRPFEGKTASDVMAAILMTEPPPLAHYLADTPRDLERIIGRMLAKDREQRSQTIGEILPELENLKREVEFKTNLIRFAPPAEAIAQSQQITGSHVTYSTHALPAETLVTASSNQFGNLSTPPTPLIGREAETAAIKQLLMQSGARMLTLTGPGGTGKTRLAVQVASDLMAEFAHGVWLVPLASINDPGLVASVIAQTLGLKESADLTLTEGLKDYLREKQMLLLLDNFEQIVAAGPLVAELLSACPKLKTLVTSRAALHLRWEHEFPVPPLAIPDLLQTTPESLGQSPAVDLFIQRARAVRPEFALTQENARAVAEICARLDGLPLAIELAAARIKVLTPQAIQQRLDRRLQLLTGGARDLPARQQTIRNTITWSYDLLGESEKILFRRLAVFVGGFTLEATESVCNRGGELEPDTLDTVTSLVDKSLLRQKEQDDGEPRFTMLETIKEYGLEQLKSSGEAQTIRQAHTKFFLDLAQNAEHALTGANQKMWLDRLEMEHNNLRAALRQAAETGDAETGILLAGALWRFWLMRSHLSEGREWLATILAMTEGEQTAARAKALIGAATLAQNQSDYDLARKLFEEGLMIYRELGDRSGVAASLTNLGWMAWRQGDYATARALSEEGLALHRESNKPEGIIPALNNLGWIAHYSGDFELAQSLFEECVSLWRNLGEKRDLAFSLTNLGRTTQKLGDTGRAAALLEEALALIRQIGDRQLIAWASCARGTVALDEGDQPSAETLLESGREQFQAVGDLYGFAYALNLLGELRYAQGKLSQAKALFSESLSLRWALKDRPGTAETLERLAWVALSENQLKRAVRLMGAAESQRESLGARLGPVERLEFERHSNAALAGLGQQAFAALWNEGRTIEPKQAVAYALGERASH